MLVLLLSFVSLDLHPLSLSKEFVMIQILPPLVVLPISVCSKKIRLLGLVPGTTVRVFANGREVVHDTAVSPDQTFDVIGSLSAGEIIRAKQDFPTEGSDLSPDLVRVLRGPAGPNELQPLSVVSRLYECGEAIWLDGAFPGASVEVTSGGASLGSAISPDGNARIRLNRPIGAGEFLSVQQTACGIASTVQTLPAPDRVPFDEHRHIPPPTVVDPLYECQQQITVSDVFDGATVTVHRDSGDEFAVFDRSSLRLNLVQPLRFGEKVSASQKFACEITSDRLVPAVPVAFQEFPAPFLHGPICKGDPSVRVSGLIPGARVMFTSSGTDFAYGTAWDSECDFPMPDLSSTHELAVKQGLCDPLRWSDLSNVVSVSEQPQQGDLFLKLTTPLFECGRKVHVRGCAPGVKVFLHSRFWHGPIGWSVATEHEVDIDALLPLTAGDQEVRVSAKLCGEDSESPREDVLRLPINVDAAGPRVVEPVHDCGGSVHVVDVVAGATVDVYVNDVFAGSTRTAFNEANVPLKKMLFDGDRVKARQSICQITTRFGDERTYLEVDDAKIVPWPTGFFSERICQLTGKKDPVAGHAHLNDTTQWGVFGTDLGVNFEHGGRLYFYFGDEGIDGSADETRDADPIFFTTDLEVAPAGIRLHPVGQPGTNVFRRLAVNGQGDLGNFEVPTGGFSFSGRHYLFISRRNPEPMRRSLLAKSTDPRNGFDFLYWIDDDPIGVNEGFAGPNPAPSEFINISPAVIKNSDWSPSVPSSSGLGLLLFGSGWYRLSGLFLAWAPLTPGSDPPAPDQWRFYDPVTQTWSAPGDKGSAKSFGGPGAPEKVGELSVTWVPQIRRWIMLSEQGIVRCHYARRPTGPWHAVNPEIFEAERDGAVSVYMHKGGTDDGLVDRDSFGNQNGAAYGPYLVPRYTKWNPWTRTATLHYVMSTHIPYQVMLMKFQLQCN
jgi:hypothetical protein